MENNLTISTKSSNVTLNTNTTLHEMLEVLKNSDKLQEIQDYILSITPKSNSITPLIREDLVEKDIFNSIPHPYFSKIQKHKIEKKNVLKTSQMDDIIVFSPHPDDEILGTCTLLHDGFQLKKNIKVIYMTSGKTAGDPFLRQKEALLSIKELGGEEKNLIFMNMPFYLTNDRTVTDEDYEVVREILRKQKPKFVFVCSDMFDPNTTHKKCFDCLFKVLSEDKEFADINVIFYYSVWYWPEEDEYTDIMPYNYTIFKCKVKAMLEHESQMLTNFMGNDPRPFYQRATSRDAKIGKKNGYEFCEIFYKYR